MDIDELIDDVVRAAQDVTAAFEQGTGSHGPERELKKARKALKEAIAAKDTRIVRLESVIERAEWYLDDVNEDGEYIERCTQCARTRQQGHGPCCPFRNWEGDQKEDD